MGCGMKTLISVKKVSIIQVISKYNLNKSILSCDSSNFFLNNKKLSILFIFNTWYIQFLEFGYKYLI